MVIPLSRHALSTGSACFASSAHRSDAFLHQWSSHISHTTTAHFTGTIAYVTFAGTNFFIATKVVVFVVGSRTGTNSWTSVYKRASTVICRGSSAGAGTTNSPQTRRERDEQAAHGYSAVGERIGTK